MRMRTEDDLIMKTSERLDADAVCAQCGMVNPSGTLICRNCGTNLRDQRSTRMAAEQLLVSEGEKPERRQVLLGLLTLLGILLIIWLALNVDRFADTLVNVQEYAGDTSRPLWSGEDGAVFSVMGQDLMAFEPTMQQMRNLLAQPQFSEEVEGVYVIGLPVFGKGVRPLGKALLQRQEEELFFLAQLENGVEIRGIGREQDNAIVVSWDEGSAQTPEGHMAVSGVALRQKDGRFDCSGAAELSETRYDFTACRVQP